MTKQLTRQEVEGVIERLADKTLSFGCEIFYGGFTNHIAISDKQEISKDVIGDYYRVSPIQTYNRKILGHPIYIGNVLSKIDKAVGGRNYYIGQTTYNEELIHLWSRCGELTLSLQEIVDASGWEAKGHTDICINCHHDAIPCIGKCDEQVLKSPEANALFSFLQEII